MILKTENLLKVYRGRKVVNDVNVEIKKGEIVGFLGPNGAGKTTTFYMIVGMVKPDRGNIILNEKIITKLPMYKRARLGIGYLAQEPSIFRGLTVEENILLPLQMTKKTKEEQHHILETLLDEFRLTKIRKNNGKILSGGERRRTEIARSLSIQPEFILLDEPFAGVDPIAVEEIQKIIVHLKEKGIGIIITDHNVAETLSITDKVYILSDGKILKSGVPEKLADDQEVKKAYLGQNFTFKRAKWYK